MNDKEITFEKEDDGSNPAVLIKKLRQKIRELEEKNREYLVGWQKERADAVNLRKRLEEEKREFAKFANENLLTEILPVLDSFDMAFANKSSWEELPQEWSRGIEYIHTQLLSALEANGIKRIYPLHKKFDPTYDEAIETIFTSNKEDDHSVLEVIQPGYSFHNKIVRTSKVKVGEYKSE